MTKPQQPDRIIIALSQVPAALTFEKFIKEPAIQSLKVGPFFLRELFELYELYPEKNH